MARVSKPKDLEDRFEEGMKADAKPKAPPIKLPKSLAACADLYSELRDTRLQADKDAAALKVKEQFVKQYLIDNIPKSDATGVAGKVAQVTIVRKRVPRLANWDEFKAHLLKTKDFSLINRALNKTAVLERWEAHKTIPGVDAFDDVTLSLHKLK